MGFLTDLAEKVSGTTPITGKELRKVKDQPKEDQDLAMWARARVEGMRASANRASYESIWLTNIAYLLGFDSVVYDTTQRKYRPVGNGNRFPNRFPNRSRTHENLLLQAVQTRLAKLCKNPPRWETRPMDESQESMERARLDFDVLTSLWQELYLNERRLDLTMRVMECAHAYMWVRWDPTRGRTMYDEMGRAAGPEGQLAVDVVSGLEVFPEELASSFDDCRYWFRVKARPLTYFRSNFDRGYLVEPEGPWPLSVQNELRIQTMTSLGGGGFGTGQPMKNAAVEITYVERPSEKYPTGRLCVVANGVKLAATPLPAGTIPLVKFDDIMIGGRYYPESPITHARPLQDQYNRNLQRTSDWVNRLVAGKYLAPRGHGIMQSGFNDQSGEIVEHNQGYKPEPLQIPNVPNWVYEERDRLKRAIFDQFGLSDISRGDIPSASIPAIGMQLLLEVDESRAAVEVEQHEHAYARLGTTMLKYAGHYVKTERPIKQKNKGDWTVKYWSGEMLSPEPEVQVVRGSTIPTSRAQRRQDISNAWQNGLLGNPQDPTVVQNVLGLMEYGDLPGVWEDYNLDSQVAEREIQAIEQDEFPRLFNENDNHILAIQKLNRFRKRREETLSPSQLEKIDTLIDMHAEAQVKRQNPQVASQLKNVQSGLLPNGADPNDMAEGAELEAGLADQEQAVSDELPRIMSQGAA